MALSSPERQIAPQQVIEDIGKREKVSNDRLRRRADPETAIGEQPDKLNVVGELSSRIIDVIVGLNERVAPLGAVSEEGVA